MTTCFFSGPNLIQVYPGIASKKDTIAYDGTSNSAFPIANLETEPLWEKWAAVTGDFGTAYDVDIALDSACSVGVIGLFGTNGQSVSVELFLDTGLASPISNTQSSVVAFPANIFVTQNVSTGTTTGITYDSVFETGTLDARPQSVFLFVDANGDPTSVQNVRGIKITMQVANAAAAIDSNFASMIGHLIVADTYVPSKGPEFGNTRGWESYADIVEGANGYVSGVDRGVGRSQRIQFPLLPDAELNNYLESMFVRHQIFRPFIFGMDIGQHNQAHYDVGLYRFAKPFSSRSMAMPKSSGARRWSVGPVDLIQWTV